jgi:hypothetical protein
MSEWVSSDNGIVFWWVALATFRRSWLLPQARSQVGERVDILLTLKSVRKINHGFFKDIALLVTHAYEYTQQHYCFKLTYFETLLSCSLWLLGTRMLFAGAVIVSTLRETETGWDRAEVGLTRDLFICDVRFLEADKIMRTFALSVLGLAYSAHNRTKGWRRIQ